MKKIFSTVLILLALSSATASVAATRPVTIEWSMSNTANVQSYQMYYSYSSDMADKLLVESCNPWVELSLNNFSMTCDNVNIETYPVYFTIAAITAEGATESYSEILTSSISIVQGFMALTPSGNAPPIAAIDYTQNGNTVDFDASASTDLDGTISEYRWNFGDGIIGTGVTVSHQFGDLSEYPVSLTVVDDKGSASLKQITIYTQTAEINARISNSLDDVEEFAENGLVSVSSSDLELTDDGNTNQIIGMRFTSISIPQGSTIVRAYIEFEADEVSTASTSIEITAEDTANALQFTNDTHNVSSRSTLNTPVAWNNITEWSAVDEKHTTSDISSLIQSIINRPDWSSGNAVAIIFNGSGGRTAESYDGEPASAPLLHIEYR